MCYYYLGNSIFGQMSVFSCPVEAAFHKLVPGFSSVRGYLLVYLISSSQSRYLRAILPVGGLIYLLHPERAEVVDGRGEKERGRQYEQTGDDH